MSQNCGYNTDIVEIPADSQWSEKLMPNSDISREDSAWTSPTYTTVQLFKKGITILSLPAAEEQLSDRAVTPLTQLPPT